MTAAVNRDDERPTSETNAAKRPNPSPAKAGRDPKVEDVRTPRQMLEVCRNASLLLGGPNLRRLGVTSALREEGRSSIALAMAIVQREDYGRKVALLDMDLENPSLARRFGLDPWPGLAELSRKEATAETVLQRLSD